MPFETDLYMISLHELNAYLILQGSSTMDTIPVRFFTGKVLRLLPP
jgi:hypothetical protein